MKISQKRYEIFEPDFPRKQRTFKPDFTTSWYVKLGRLGKYG